MLFCVHFMVEYVFVCACVCVCVCVCDPALDSCPSQGVLLASYAHNVLGWTPDSGLSVSNLAYFEHTNFLELSLLRNTGIAVAVAV